MDGPGVSIPIILSSEQIAVGRVGIDSHQDRLVAVEDFVVQSNPNLGQVLGCVDGSCELSSELMQVVHAAHADGYTQNVAHEFHHATVGTVTNEGEGQNDLAQPRFGDRKIEQDLVICSRGSKGIVDRFKRQILLLVDELATDVVIGCQTADVGRARHCLDSQVHALSTEKFGCRESR